MNQIYGQLFFKKVLKDIIDPKGVVGDPIFDINRFILNEFNAHEKISFEYYHKHIEMITNYFEKSLNIPVDVIKKCLFIETAMANCWNVESRVCVLKFDLGRTFSFITIKYI